MNAEIEDEDMVLKFRRIPAATFRSSSSMWTTCLPCIVRPRGTTRSVLWSSCLHDEHYIYI